jgi:hypothetical protein
MWLQVHSESIAGSPMHETQLRYATALEVTGSDKPRLQKAFSGELDKWYKLIQIICTNQILMYN